MLPAEPAEALRAAQQQIEAAWRAYPDRPAIIDALLQAATAIEHAAVPPAAKPFSRTAIDLSASWSRLMGRCCWPKV
ncbi:MAG: hypothetical protein MO852_00240 [Candidatus Devosia euplotis]|nr:hypothetical protein [Candidatus Devosia euplotis]